MKSLRALIVSLSLVAGSVAHATTLTSITPVTGPTAGGTHVTVKGTSFGPCPICSPPGGPP